MLALDFLAKKIKEGLEIKGMVCGQKNKGGTWVHGPQNLRSVWPKKKKKGLKEGRGKMVVDISKSKVCRPKKKKKGGMRDSPLQNRKNFLSIPSFLEKPKKMKGRGEMDPFFEHLKAGEKEGGLGATPKKEPFSRVPLS